MTVRRLAVLLATLAALALAAPAWAADGSLVGIRPADPAESWARMEVPPGGSARSEAIVINLSDDPQTVRLSTADGITTPEGAFTLASDGDVPTGVGAWAVPDETELSLAPGERRKVGFTLTVPAGVTPGDYAGGLIVQTAAPVQRATGEGVAITVVERVGMRIYERVPGARDGRVEVVGLSATRLGGIRSTMGMPNGLDVRFRARSLGNVRHERLLGTITLLDGDREVAVRAVDLGTLLPGGERDAGVRLPLSGMGGDYTVRVMLAADPPVTAEVDVSVKPVVLYAGGGLAAVALIGLAGWFRRSRRGAERR